MKQPEITILTDGRTYKTIVVEWKGYSRVAHVDQNAPVERVVEVLLAPVRAQVDAAHRNERRREAAFRRRMKDPAKLKVALDKAWLNFWRDCCRDVGYKSVLGNTAAKGSA
jgi:hypothetical protein